ncbi:MAG: peptidylprolyl isomerase [Eubacteriales bacterium]
MGSKKYSNKGYNAARKAEEQAAEEKANRRTVWICLAAVLVIIVAVIAVVIVSQNTSGTQSGKESQTSAPSATINMSDIAAEINSKSVSDFEETDQTTEYVKITVKDHGDIILRLRADVAPITVANFQSLAGQGFYDGLTFHRVYKNFMIQGGDPKGNGTGNSGTTIKGEFSSNGVTNDLSHIRGVLSMARGSYSMDSASCQFFICHADSTFLDGDYASFGYVVAGMDTVDSVADVEVQANSSGEKSSPVEPVVIEKICFVTEKQS